jgi:hypothetical protein
MPACTRKPEAGAAPPLALRVSPLLTAARVVGVLLAAGAAAAGLQSWLGAWPAGAAGLCLAAGLAVAARRHARRSPAQLQFGEGGTWLAAFDRDGRCLAAGHITACAQWSDRLLALRVNGQASRRGTLLVPADALDAAAFRRLCAGARSAARRAAASF